MVNKRLSKRDFVTITSISSYCMVSPTTVRRWIKDGKLHAAKLPSGHFRVTVEDLMEFLQQNELTIPDELLHKDQE